VTQQLTWVADVLNDAGVDYWADSGTLLALMRDGELLPTDPHIDLAIWSDADVELRSTFQVFEAEGYRVRTERYRDLAFNHTCVPPLRSGLKRIDVYVYREADGYAWAPAIVPAPPARGRAARALGAPWRFLLRALWARVVRQVTVDSWPWRGYFEMRTWWIPRALLDGTTALPGVPHRVPARWEEYLQLKYGTWRVPATEWSFWTDDGAIRADRPEALLSLDATRE
jgi:hypothetical protein